MLSTNGFSRRRRATIDHHDFSIVWSRVQSVWTTARQRMLLPQLSMKNGHGLKLINASVVLSGFGFHEKGITSYKHKHKHRERGIQQRYPYVLFLLNSCWHARPAARELACSWHGCPVAFSQKRGQELHKGKTHVFQCWTCALCFARERKNKRKGGLILCSAVCVCCRCRCLLW